VQAATAKSVRGVVLNHVNASTTTQSSGSTTTATTTTATIGSRNAKKPARSPLRNRSCSPPPPPPPALVSSHALDYSDTAKDWNERYQRIVDMPRATPHQRLQQTLELGQLENAFRLAASRIGRTIIHERSLPNSAKTYRPIDAGGQAGGVKFMEQGIFFKVFWWRPHRTP
jgi:Clustered mitochondria